MGRTWLVPFSGMLLAGCAAAVASPQATQTLRPFERTSATVPAALISPTLPLLPTVGPSPTPVSYTVKSGDTLLAIALRYGVTLDGLQAANPGVNPDFLRIGQVILIPGPQGQATATPPASPTPIPIPLSPVHCYRTLSNGLWCLTTARNSGAPTVEGLTVLVTLVDEAGRPLLTLSAYPPLNLLHSGQAMALAAFAPPPAPDFARAVAGLMSAVPAVDEAKRYRAVRLQGLRQDPAADRMSWRVSGNLSLADGDAASAAVVAIALDPAGEAVGYSKWEAPGPVKAGDNPSFSLTVFSLGPAIDSLTILAEAQAPTAP